MTGQPEYLDHNFAEEPTRMAPDFALDETVAISGESLQDLPPDFEDCSSVTPEEMREFTTKLQTTTEIGKFDEAIDAQDLFTAFVQLGVAYENKLENLFVMQQKFVELIDQYLADDKISQDDSYVKLLEILKALVVSGELDRVFENVTSSTNEKLRQLTGVVTDERTKIKAQEAMVEITFSVFRRSISDEYCDVLTAYAQLENAHKLGMEEYVQMKVDFLRFLNRELKKSAEARDEKLRENLLRLRERVQSGGLDADESLM